MRDPRIAKILAEHQPDGAFCTCEYEYDNADVSSSMLWDEIHAKHQADLLEPLLREAEAVAFKRGFDDAHNQHTAHRERRNLPHPGIAYANPYRSNDQ